MAEVFRQGRSLAETPTYLVATVVTVMVFVCLLVERSIYRFGKWLKNTRRKALYVSLEKIKEEMMLLGLLSLLLAQSARWISEICVNSSLFSSRFYLCSEEDYSMKENIMIKSSFSSTNVTDIPPKGLSTNQCGEGREPFVSYEGLEQLHRFLFVLGITHVLYSCVAVGLAMSKIYSWRKWEIQASLLAEENLRAKKPKVMRRQSTFVFHHTSHPWSRSRVLIWMLCFLHQFRSSIKKPDYLALRFGFVTKHKLPHSYDFHKYMVRSMEDEFQGILGISWPLWVYAIVCIFINIHGLNIYFWLSFIPAINAFEMATFIWSLWGFKQRSCFMKNRWMIVIRLASGLLVQFWCSYSTVPLNVIVTQMGSRFKKALVSESVRESLHSWCKRVKERSKLRDSLHSHTTRSVCSLDTTIDERDEITVASGTLSRSSSIGSLNHGTVASDELVKPVLETSDIPGEISLRVEEFLSDSIRLSESHPPTYDEEDNAKSGEESKVDTLFELFQKT
ncbi:MLO-like protein 4 isoform X2 [Castanea sativa]|uniref:MLO-like protein 4 isoform X2 n=1 Tax=Castanea sativa TaxID=21020 RepID=UPI003F649B4D